MNVLQGKWARTLDRHAAFGEFHKAKYKSLREFELERIIEQQAEEMIACTQHLSVMYEQIHSITHLARVLKLSLPFDDVIDIFERILAETLEIKTVFYLELSEDVLQVQSSTIASRVSPETIVRLEQQLIQASGDVVFACDGDLKGLLCTRVRSKNMVAWLVAVPCVERVFGSEESQFMLTISRMLESHLLNRSLFEEKDLMQIAFVRSLISTLDARDHYTQGHSLRVAEVAADLANRMGLAHEEIDAVYTSGLLHDIGKIGISDHVLRKSDQLTDSDWEEIKRHPVVGYEILSKIPQFENILPGVRHHHERVDGKGYPDGIRGSELAIMPRILAVADAFDAMSSDRPYRPGMPEGVVNRILARGAGTQWDTGIIALFLEYRKEIRKSWSCSVSESCLERF